MAPDHPDDGARDHSAGQWLALGRAAQELGLTRSAVYRRIRAGTLMSRPRGNRGLEVFVAPDDRDHPRDEARHGAPDDRDQSRYGARDDRADVERDELQARIEELLERVGRAEGEAAGLRSTVVELREALARATAHTEQERARGDRLEAALTGARRPWLARVLEGLRRKGG